MFNTTPWPLSAGEGDLVPIVQKAWLVSVLVWMVVESLSCFVLNPELSSL